MHSPARAPGGPASRPGAAETSRLGPRALLGRYLIDLGLLLASLYLARWLRLVVPLGRPLDPEGVALHPLMVLLILIVWSLSLAAFRAHPGMHWRDTVEEIQAVVGAITVAALVYAGVLYLTYRGLSRLLYAYFYALNLASTLAVHLWWQRRDRARGTLRRRVAIVGSGDEAARLARQLGGRGTRPVTVVGLITEEHGSVSEQGLPTLGSLSEAGSLLATHDIDELVIGSAERSGAALEALLHDLQALPVTLTLASDTSQVVLSRAQVEALDDLVLIHLNAPVLGPLDRAVKRAFDMVVATLALIVLLPLWGLVALAIALDSRGPILYRSRRLGEGERPFEMLKFRTMVTGADRQQEALISAGNGEIAFAKQRDDPRITRVGRVLRRWSLDELPQLVNVLRGEMSLVGPRPELPEVAALYAPWQRRRFNVPQGMTGWWQVSGRSDQPKARHVEDDLHYIRNYGLLLDLEILWRTVGAVLRGRGAY